LYRNSANVLILSDGHAIMDKLKYGEMKQTKQKTLANMTEVIYGFRVLGD
jgi:hypothetical protein